MTKISKNIKRLRNAQGISQEALAEKLFISRQAVSSWENDRTQPDIEMIGKLAEVFNVSIEELKAKNANERLLKNLEKEINSNDIYNGALSMATNDVKNVELSYMVADKLLREIL